MRNILGSLLSGLLVLSMFVGCSSKEGLSGLYSCEGKVTHNGSPVAGASVNFYPDGGDAEARTAGASTDANGDFKLTTLKPQDGAFPGNYKVTVAKFEEYGPEPPKVMNSEGELVPAGRPVKNTLPAKYEKKETSGLTATIEKKKNTVNLELTD